MIDKRLDQLANILVNHSVKVQSGDWVMVHADLAALPLVEEVVRKVLRAGGKPSFLFSSDEITGLFLEEASEDVLRWISPPETLLFKQVNAIIYLGATLNSRSLSEADPKRNQIYQLAHGELRMIRNQRVLEDQLRWVYTQFPCAAYAQDADMSLRNYEDFFYHAAFADQSDPISLWQAVHTQQIRLVQWLNQKNEVIMQGPNIDLKLSISDRIFINGSGQDNIPDGEIYTGPVENSVNGWVRFTYPGIKDGREVTGIELEFTDGRVTAARADKNEAFLQSTLDTDEGARFLGEFAIGTNPAIQRFTRNILFDEKIGGTIHLALGNGYPETGSLNRSAIHWDLICDMRQESQIVVDGDLFYRNGEFLL